MTRRLALVLALMTPMAALAEPLSVSDAVVALAPPGVMVHAAYFSLENEGPTPRRLIGVRAEGYAMAHLHRSEESGDVATMSAVDVIDLAPGQRVVFAPGGLHVMLMHPASPQLDGATVQLTLVFANGDTQQVLAETRRMQHGS